MSREDNHTRESLSEVVRAVLPAPTTALARSSAAAPLAGRPLPKQTTGNDHGNPPVITPSQLSCQPSHGPRAAFDKAAAQRRAFNRLQPACAPLLALREDPRALAVALERLAELLPSVDPVGLAACLDYVLFPLLFTVDSAALLRAPAQPGNPLAQT